jgi:hypothetical protein
VKRYAFLMFSLAGTLVALPAHAGGFLLDASGGYFNLAGSKESAKAVFGSSGGVTFGGDVGYVFGEHIFVSAGARVFDKEGERVFVAQPGGTAFPLGHPLKLRLVPAQATIGYRFTQTRLFGLALTPYVGVGGGVTSYREESTVGGLTESESFSKASGHGLAGVELGGGGLRLGIEACYSVVPNAVGVGGVSKLYGEDDVGGFTILGKIVFTTAR